MRLLTKIFAAALFFWLPSQKALSGAYGAALPAAGSALKGDASKICRAALLPVSYLNISVRAKNVLKKHNVKTILDLIQMAPEDLRKLPGLGWSSFVSVARGLREEGLQLKTRLSPEQAGVFQAAGFSPEQKNYMEQPVESLQLSHRAQTRLKREGISYIGELIEMTEDELLLIDYLGKNPSQRSGRPFGAGDWIWG